MQDINAPPHICMQKILDVANYPKYVPALKSIEIYHTEKFKNVRTYLLHTFAHIHIHVHGRNKSPVTCVGHGDDVSLFPRASARLPLQLLALYGVTPTHPHPDVDTGLQQIE